MRPAREHTPSPGGLQRPRRPSASGMQSWIAAVGRMCMCSRNFGKQHCKPWTIPYNKALPFPAAHKSPTVFGVLADSQ